MKTACAWLVIAAPLFAAEMRTHRGLPYVQPQEERRSLDVYAPKEGADRPVIVWIHGGGWRQGDKAGVQRKPQAFVDRGYVFVSVNYRFVPQVTVKEMAGDIAQAVRWVRDHARDYGGSPDRLILAGHSAGAHLAALVCTDVRYFETAGVPMSAVKGCIPVDTAAYDVALRAASALGAIGNAEAVFGKTAESHRELSPITYVARDRGIPPFLILHVADRPDSTAQSIAFAKLLNDAGVSARTVAGEGKTHGTINSDLGRSDDPPTIAVFEFLQTVAPAP